MIKHISRSLIILLTVFAFAFTANAGENKAQWKGVSDDTLNLARGEEVDIQLSADIPAGKKLNAYSFMVMYDEDVIQLEAVAAEDADIPPANINTDNAGEIFVNGFDIKGTEKGKTALIDVKVKALEPGDANISVLFSAFGASADDQCLPKAKNLKVNVK
jgi:hypothetical protein